MYVGMVDFGFWTSYILATSALELLKTTLKSIDFEKQSAHFIRSFYTRGLMTSSTISKNPNPIPKSKAN